jgi:Cdc6-like AAA superfamily ATPase
MSGNADEALPQRNPFSRMAVAKITGYQDSDAVELTIQTDAIRQAIDHLSRYLHAAPADGGQDQNGDVIAIVGDYGAGKTHLSIELVRHASRVLNDSARAMYLDAPADGFVELYRRFIWKLGLAGVRNRVNDYYADIVAESLQSSGLNSDVIEWLRSRELVPQDVVDKLGLMESALLRKVQRTLQRVTENSDFGTALTLLLRSGFDDVVWAWLMGEEPAKVLVDRGITNPIDNDVAALEAMGIFALLYGGPQARFVLVIDEMDKIFSAANKPEQETMAAFQKMLEVFAGAGACLVLTGLPEFLSVLHPSVSQRVSHRVRMAGLSTDEVCSFIKLAQHARFGRDELAPFTRDSVRYLRDITGGNPRSVIRMCHDVYGIVDDARRATGNPDLLVTDVMVRQAARRQLGALSADDIVGVVRRILDANGWSYLRKHVVGTASDSMVDFWVTFPDRAGGCAVLLTESVLDYDDVNVVARRSLAVREAAPDAKVILVVSGVLTELFAARLADSLDAEPLVYEERSFAENFRALVGATSNQLRTAGDGSPQTVILQRIDQINRQQTSLYNFMERLAEHIDGVRGSSERRFSAVQRELDALARVTRGSGQPSGATTPSVLPAGVDRLFRDAVDLLDELTQLDAMMGEALDQPSRETKQALQDRFSTGDYIDAIGVGLLIREAVIAFRAAVARWYATEVSGSSVELSPAADQRLDMLCRAYDAVTEFLPTSKLDPLIRLGPWTARGGAGVAEMSQMRRHSRVRGVLDNLSPNVRRALPRSVPARGH